MKVGVVTAQFNSQMTEILKEGAVNLLEETSWVNKLKLVSVPGALEIPLAAKWLIENQNCDGVIGLGVVIRGETTHYDYVCSGSERGCSEIQLLTGKPVVFGVLTVENRSQAWARITGRKGNKGTETAKALLDMLKLQKELQN